MPLVSVGRNAGTGGQFEQPELPAWLESLRAHERPVGNMNSPTEQQPFSMSDLVDENSMPSWMRLDQARLSESSDALPALSSNAHPGGSEAPSVPTSGFTASSLLDESALPSWMRGQDAGRAETEQNLVAGNLIQPESLPAWMKSLDNDQSGTGQGLPSVAIPTPPAVQGMSPAARTSIPPGTGKGMAPPARPGAAPAAGRGTPPPARPGIPPATDQEITTAGLLQSGSLPAWMKNLDVGGSAQSSSWQTGEQYGLPTGTQQAGISGGLPQTPISPLTPFSGSGGLTSPPAQGFAASDLVDQRSLPEWMTAQDQGQQARSRPVPGEQGFAAGELLDQQSLPAWMKDQRGQGNTGPVSAMGVPVSGSGQIMGMDQGTTGGVGMPAANLLDASTLPSWMQENAPGTAQPAERGMVAGSLIDVNALPDWMRNQDNPQSATGAYGGQTQAPTRFEGVRVPGRPRGEITSQEQSEAAANVFASMLGVSASAPTFPGQSPVNTSLGVAQGQPVQPVPPAQSIIPGWQSPSPAPASQRQPVWQASGGAASPIPDWQTQPSGLPPASVNNTQIPTRIMEPSSHSGIGDMNRGAAGPVTGANIGTGAGNNNADARGEGVKKKGFFDSIRDFFFK